MNDSPNASGVRGANGKDKYIQKKRFELALYFLVFLLLGGVLYVFYSFINQLPIEGTTLAMDWKSLWDGLHYTRPIYSNSTTLGLRIAPWSLWAIWPIGQLPFRASWATLSLLTLVSLIFSVPRTTERKLIWLASIILLVSSYISMRHIADGNLEGVMIAGLTILVYGYNKQNPVVLALGILMATAKMQEVWLFLIVFGIYFLKAWKFTDRIKAFALVCVVAVPSLLFFGNDWISSMAVIIDRVSITDSSLMATTSRLGLHPVLRISIWTAIFLATLWVALKSHPTISREKVGLLVSASLILSPYFGYYAFLTIFAIGIIPLFQTNLFLGGFLIACVDALFFLSPLFIYQWSAIYIFGLTLLTWVILLVRLDNTERHGIKSLGALDEPAFPSL